MKLLISYHWSTVYTLFSIPYFFGSRVIVRLWACGCVPPAPAHDYFPAALTPLSQRRHPQKDFQYELLVPAQVGADLVSTPTSLNQTQHFSRHSARLQLVTHLYFKETKASVSVPRIFNYRWSTGEDTTSWHPWSDCKVKAVFPLRRGPPSHPPLQLAFEQNTIILWTCIWFWSREGLSKYSSSKRRIRKDKNWWVFL